MMPIEGYTRETKALKFLESMPRNERIRPLAVQEERVNQDPGHLRLRRERPR